MKNTHGIMPFDFSEERSVRTLIRDGEVWFVAKDVCDILDIKNVSDALEGLDEDERNTLANSEGIQTGRGNPNMNIVNESGLYNLIFSSRKPEARTFRKWVTSVVLPEIRRSGGFGQAMREEDFTRRVEEAADRRLQDILAKDVSPRGLQIRRQHLAVKQALEWMAEELEACEGGFVFLIDAYYFYKAAAGLYALDRKSFNNLLLEVFRPLGGRLGYKRLVANEQACVALDGVRFTQSHKRPPRPGMGGKVMPQSAEELRAMTPGIECEKESGEESDD